VIDIYSRNIHPSIRNLLSYATTEDKVDREYEKYIQLENRKLYGYELEGKIVACIGIDFSSSLNECEIKHIAVSLDQRGKGIGSKMIKYICDKHSLNYISAETDKDAVDFYRIYGFEIRSLGEKYPDVERFLCVYKH
jgi:N-acetylglutamate synthase-like GNAT family acetyltransferase